MSKPASNLTNGKRPRYRPEIVWPVSVVLLILLGMATSLSVVFFSQSGGGTQVIDNYYHKAVMWDSLASIRQASDALGWKVEVEVDHKIEADGRLVTLSFTDEKGHEIDDLEGYVQLFRPQFAARQGEATIQITDVPGVYRCTLPINKPGLWDFTIRATNGTDHFENTVRKEILQ